MKIPAENLGSTIATLPLAKPAAAQRPQQPAVENRSGTGGDKVTISAQARSLAAASQTSEPAPPVDGTPRPALAVPGTPAGPGEAGKKTTEQEQAQRAPERAVAQAQQGAQAAQGRINLLA